MDKGRISIVITLAALLLVSCVRQQSTPKPRGYFRIDFPEKAYKTYSPETGCPFSFRIPTYASINPDSSENANAHPCWMNMDFPEFNATIHFSYWPVGSEKMLYQLVEDSRDLAFKHTIKASAIDEQLIIQPEKDLYGIIYKIRGNTASSLQFFLTDSTSHYLRGALYFNEAPRIDSIRPVLDFIRQDIDTLINSFEWRLRP